MPMSWRMEPCFLPKSVRKVTDRPSSCDHRRPRLCQREVQLDDYVEEGSRCLLVWPSNR